MFLHVYNYMIRLLRRGGLTREDCVLGRRGRVAAKY
jgi:hypothetical protein